MAAMSLAYLGLAVTDQKAWLKFAVDGLGLMHCGEAGGSHRLRLDERAWRIALHQASGNDSNNDILYAGFDLDSLRSVEALRTRFHENAIVHRDLTADECRTRGVSMGITTKDPEGLALEFVFSCEIADRPFRSPHQGNFVTGEGGLGHIVLSVKDPESSLALYQSIGFSVSDYIDITVGPGMTVRIAFLHCNRRHHTIALAPSPGSRRLDHIMLETATVDGVITAYYRLLQQGYTMKRHLGRHPNDGVLSFYVTTPAGFDFEFGSEGVEIDREWEVRTYDRISVWGHNPVLR
jgi:biphenyl-2,3-diol 1,2-dioxygenase